jgi:hypothetical protein
MSLKIISSEPCWNILYKKLKTEYPELCEKNITLCINQLSPIENTKNILWLHESPALLENIIFLLKTNEEAFKNSFFKIYSCINELKKYSFVEYIHPSNSSWVKNSILNLNKTKNMSMITSNKNYTKGHKIRNFLVNNLPDNVDLYGKGYNEIEYKDQGLSDYRFSIAIENDDTDCYFSEKLLDCFLTSTIPIYWGSRCISNIFNNDGIVWLDDIKDLKLYDENYYKSKESAIKENYFLALQNNIDPYDSLKKILIEN